MLAALAKVVEQATAYSFEGGLHHRPRGDGKFFWGFCDDYLETVKEARHRHPG